MLHIRAFKSTVREMEQLQSRDASVQLLGNAIMGSPRDCKLFQRSLQALTRMRQGDGNDMNASERLAVALAQVSKYQSTVYANEHAHNPRHRILSRDRGILDTECATRRRDGKKTKQWNIAAPGYCTFSMSMKRRKERSVLGAFFRVLGAPGRRRLAPPPPFR